MSGSAKTGLPPDKGKLTSVSGLKETPKDKTDLCEPEWEWEIRVGKKTKRKRKCAKDTSR